MANTELLRQIAEEGRRERTAGPTPEKILRVQRVDIGNLEDFKKQLEDKVMSLIDHEVNMALAKMDKQRADFAKVLSQFQFNMKKDEIKRVGDAYTITNRTVRRTMDADDTTLNELADLVATLIYDLQRSRIIK